MPWAYAWRAKELRGPACPPDVISQKSEWRESPGFKQQGARQVINKLMLMAGASRHEGIVHRLPWENAPP